VGLVALDEIGENRINQELSSHHFLNRDRPHRHGSRFSRLPSPFFRRGAGGEGFFICAFHSKMLYTRMYQICRVSGSWMNNELTCFFVVIEQGEIRMAASVFQILFIVFGFVFNFWPFLILAPLQNLKSGIRNMVYIWGLWAVIRIILFFNPEPVSISLLIPEPLSTILFFITGLLLIAIWIGQTYWRRSRTRKQAFGLSSKGLLDLPPGNFEEMVTELYRAMGHQARRTGIVGDHGLDVVVKAKNGEKWVVQCKRWRTRAGESVVRDFYGMMQHERATQGAIFATSGFSQAALEWAKGKPLILYDGSDFLRLWKKVKEQYLQETKRSNDRA
jgi:hypothetical protein